MVYGIWYMVYGIWYMVYANFNIKYEKMFSACSAADRVWPACAMRDILWYGAYFSRIKTKTKDTLL